ncbi:MULTISPECIES: toll/interleukin-1 receptor domain-containing protein [unclassified Pseudomonas]|jgi:CBS domain-containing protein|uniref:toll/interleukin-1 receptor domain-containing protein n=1 Tax=unclassified Pseudomonas TaxID=196821 RepID=UPI0015A430A2|nr:MULTISPECIES: toll/interleukin-1 receptor domain-containing protein [unclassified Pseudomonas]NWA31504.1 toll/interleukin-1 receptor domain-containing protein [Pseudomonas sp. C6002]NWB64283.1 toll/interleukin-1 receptor domain-containing protein [Pseudomonas sp. F1002]
MDAPKVFVSHASEDKLGFVMPFAERLISNGIDAWVDKWEIKVGDSLVKKIFEEGLGAAQAVIVVLSKHSVNKPWVREELDLAVVNKISEGTRIIPVVLDDCEVPQALKSTKWVSFKNSSTYEDSFNEIVATIFGASDKPPLGSPPSYVTQFKAGGVAGQNNIDSLVTRLACEAALKSGHSMVGPEAFKKNGEFVIPEQTLRDSLEYLTEYGAINWQQDLSGSLRGVSVNDAGFELYAREHVPSYAEHTRALVSLIVNSGIRSNSDLKEQLKISPFLVDHILRTLRDSGSIRTTWFIGGECSIDHVSASLRRTLS